jgi:virginiamycin B lyase
MQRFAVGIILAALFHVVPSSAAVGQCVVSITGIAAGSDGALWFTQPGCDSIGRITTTGAVAFFPIPTANGGPNHITAGPDGNLWFTEGVGNKIGRITIAGVITEFDIPTANAFPGLIASGPDGALWFAENNLNKIGRITITGTITEFTTPTSNSGPQGIAWGPDGALWFTESTASKIGRITTAGSITEFALPPNSGPDDIVAGPDGALWFAASSANAIGRITIAGAITEFPVPTPNSGPFRIAVGPDGALWFTDLVAHKIGRITTSGQADDFQLPPPPGVPTQIITGPDGNLWVVDSDGDILTFAPPPATSPLFAATLPPSRSVQVGGEVATAFASIVNTGTSVINCGIAPVTPVPANFLFQTTDPATNQLTGTPNTRVPIAAGVTQSYLVAFTPNAPVVPTNVVLGYDCDNIDAVGTIVGVNTLLLTFSATPVPDVIAVGLTPSNDGYSHTGGNSGTGIFVIAAMNIGASGHLTAQVMLSNSTMPLTATVCQTNPNTGQCLAPPTASVTTTIGADQNTTWTAFLTASGAIAQDAANNRVFFEFVDGSALVRGSTSTAVTTQ